METLKILLLVTFAIPRLAIGAALSDFTASQDESGWTAAMLKAQSQFQQRKFVSAAGSAKRALQIAKRFGPSDNRLAVTYLELAGIYRDWGHCAESRAAYSRGISTLEKAPIPNRRYLFYSITNMVSTLCECDDFNTAERTLLTYADKLQSYESDPRDEARLLSIRAGISRARKNYEQAEMYYRSEIELLEKTPSVPLYLIQHERAELAIMIGKHGNHAQSLAESERLVALLENDGSRSIDLVLSLNNAACELAALDRKHEAERMFERALAAAVDFYGEENRFTAKIMLNIAQIMRENKESPAADAMQKRGMEAMRHTFVRDSATVDVADLDAQR
jgi:tetratricopeptide (TPR) repeat protein